MKRTRSAHVYLLYRSTTVVESCESLLLQYLSAEGSNATEGSKRLTDRLLTFTRQQRHLAMRVIISTLVWVLFVKYAGVRELNRDPS